jgi:hypothetical protein
MVFVAVIFLLDDSLFLTPLSAEWILSDVYSLLDKIDQIHSSELSTKEKVWGMVIKG